MENRIQALCVFFGTIFLVVVFAVAKFRLLFLLLLAACVAMGMIMLNKTLKEFLSEWKALFAEGFNHVKHWFVK